MIFQQINEWHCRFQLIQVFRKNDNLKLNVIAIREKKNSVKEILRHNNDILKIYFLYFNSNYDPTKVREVAEKNYLISLLII